MILSGTGMFLKGVDVPSQENWEGRPESSHKPEAPAKGKSFLRWPFRLVGKEFIAQSDFTQIDSPNSPGKKPFQIIITTPAKLSHPPVVTAGT
jgi:hypothetical protein